MQRIDAYISIFLLSFLHFTNLLFGMEQMKSTIEADEVSTGKSGVMGPYSAQQAVKNDAWYTDQTDCALGLGRNKTPIEEFSFKEKMFEILGKSFENENFQVVLDKESYEEVSKVLNNPRKVGREWIELCKYFKEGFLDEVEAQKRLEEFITLYSHMKTSQIMDFSMDQPKTRTIEQNEHVGEYLKYPMPECIKMNTNSKPDASELPPTDHIIKSYKIRPPIDEPGIIVADHKDKTWNRKSDSDDAKYLKKGPNFSNSDKNFHSEKSPPEELSPTALSDTKETQKEQKNPKIKFPPFNKVTSVEDFIVGESSTANIDSSNTKMKSKNKKGKKPRGPKTEKALDVQSDNQESGIIQDKVKDISSFKETKMKDNPSGHPILKLLAKTLQLYDLSKYSKVELSEKTFKELENKWGFDLDVFMSDTLPSVSPFSKDEHEAHRRFASFGHQYKELKIKQNWEKHGKGLGKEATRMSFLLKVDQPSPSFVNSTEDEMKELTELVDFMDKDEWDRVQSIFEGRLMIRLGTFGFAAGTMEYKDSKVLKYALKKGLASQGINIPVLSLVTKLLELDSAEVSWETAKTSDITSKVDNLVKLMTGTNQSSLFLGTEPLESWISKYTRDHLCYAGDWLSKLFQSRLKLLARVCRGTYRDLNGGYVKKQFPWSNEISLGEELIATHVGINLEMLTKLKDCFHQQKPSNPFIKKGTFVGKWDASLPSEIQISTVKFHEYFQLLEEKVINLDNWINEKLKGLKKSSLKDLFS
ncbi:hypothetical protein DFH28DRAFT_888814 [Melampsora americana]|nr:hypothetical protein DFH28DRAFT_888814 [Melampsora americana]